MNSLNKIIENNKTRPDLIDRLERNCFVCNKQHIVTGGLIVRKLIHKKYKGTLYIFVRSAHIGCFLAHNQKWIKDFYKEKDWFGWKHKRR